MLLIVFDFDWTMADQDTDRWVFEVLDIGIRRKMEDLESKMQWTDIVADALREGHERGISKDDILQALRNIPFHPAMVRAVKQLKSTGKATLLCLSNANSVFIPTVLEANEIPSIFDEVITNPAHWEPSGLLNLRRRVDPDGPQHSCRVGCNLNMCKGEELDAFLQRSQKEYDRVVYVGDGSNDFCPVLRLRSQDLVLCRTGKGLERRITREGKESGLKCEVKYWEGAWEIEEIFKTFAS